MKRFKQIDTWVSVTLIVGFAFWALIKFDYTLIYGYFVVGCWHVVSMIIHGINGWFCEKGGRRYYYQWVVGSIFVIAALGMVLYPVLFVLLVGLLFLAPFMAVLYTCLCYHEVYVKMRRPMALLK